jgi:hypothetical protein
MTIGFLFWLLMVLWLVLGLYVNRPAISAGNYGLLGGNLLLFVLLFLLGWQVFGFILRSGS